INAEGIIRRPNCKLKPVRNEFEFCHARLWDSTQRAVDGMDKDLFYISLFMIVVGVAGQLVWIFFAGIPCVVNGNYPYLLGAACNPHATAASFQELQNIT